MACEILDELLVKVFVLILLAIEFLLIMWSALSGCERGVLRLVEERDGVFGVLMKKRGGFSAIF